MIRRSVSLALLGVLAVALATPAEGRAAATAAKAKGKRVAVSPRPGQVVRSHHVRLRVRSRTLTDTLRVRLNGAPIGEDFGPPRRGTRTLRASLSHGLRRGRNVLRVRVRSRRGTVRTTTVRFLVRTRRHLVGAGSDREVAIDGTVRLRGAVRTHPHGDTGVKLRWRLVRAPRRTGAHDALLAGAAPHTFTSRGGKSASFRPRVPGSYTLRLSAGGDSRAASDTVIFEATPRSRLVPIETMTAMDKSKGDGRGIRVGDTTYLLRDARGFATAQQNDLQVLVLKRATLEFVSNTTYPVPEHHVADLGRLKADLAGLGDANLVIVVLQPNPGVNTYFGFDGVLGRVGVAASGGVLLQPGELSAIGVPGMAAGDAETNVTWNGPLEPVHQRRPGPMTGYLTPDQWGNFGFVPKARVPFTFGPKPPAACTPANNGGRDCIEGVGFRIRHFDARTGAPAAHDGQFYNMQFRNNDPRDLAVDLNSMPDGDVVMIEAVSNRPEGQAYFPPIGAIGRGEMVELGNVVARLGGTRNAFNRIARRAGSDANGGMTYALVGWQGAGEGAGLEVAAGVDGAGEAPSLSGVLRPNRQSLFRPVEEGTGPDALTDLVMEEPTTKWPLDDEPGPKAALSWLGSNNRQISSDPRADYRSQPYDKADWDAIAADVEKVAYTAVPADARKDFTEPEFNRGRDQLVKELRWVGNVRSYLGKLASPISDSEVLSYAKVKEIGTRVYKEAQEPKDESALRWIEFTEILLEIAGPITHEVSSAVAAVMELGVWMSGADEKGRPVEEVPFEADELGDKIVDQMTHAVATYTRMGDVIVTDPEKLAFVGENGACSPNSQKCPKGWSFSTDDITNLKADLARTVERTAYEELLPLGFAVYGLNPERLDRAPDPRWYNCNLYPFYYYSDTAVSLGTTPLLRELDPQNANRDLWKLLVLARPGGAATYYHAKPPSDTTLQRVFGPVSNTTSPDEGGLGVSLARLVAEEDWQFWVPIPRVGTPTHDGCS